MKYLFDSTYYSSIIPRDSLVGEWTGDHYSTNKTILLDTSGNNKHGTITGVNIIYDSIFGSSLSFAGNNSSYIIIADTTDKLYKITSNGLSISCWVKNYSTSWAYMINKIAAISGSIWEWGIVSSLTTSGYFYAIPTSSGGGSIRQEHIVSSVGEYIHMVINFTGPLNSNEIKIYKNNVKSNLLDATYAQTYTANNTNLIFGVGYGSNAYRCYKGLLKNIRIYNKNLTTEEIGLLYSEYANCLVNN